MKVLEMIIRDASNLTHVLRCQGNTDLSSVEVNRAENLLEMFHCAGPY